MNMNSYWYNKTVIVAGATEGAGRAMVRHFAHRGASLGLLGQGAEPVEAACRELAAIGVNGVGISVEPTDADDVETAMDRIARTLGPSDVCIVNGMVATFSDLVRIDGENLLRIKDTIYRGTTHVTMSMLARMLRRDRGVILFVASALPHRDIVLHEAYRAARRDVERLFAALQRELEQCGSRVRVATMELPALHDAQFDWARSAMPQGALAQPPVYPLEVAARLVEETARTYLQDAVRYANTAASSRRIRSPKVRRDLPAVP